jgi:hypothetical protein
VPDSPGFGRAGYQWDGDPGQDPAEIAAQYMHHRLLVRVRDHLGTRAPAARIAEALGAKRDSAAEKHIRRLVSGELKLTIADLLRCCHVFKIEPSEALGRGLGYRNSYPDIYRALLDTSSQPLPTFRRRPRVDWSHICEAVVRQLSTEDASELEFTTEQVIRHQVVQELAAIGVPRAIIAPRGSAGIHLGGSIAEDFTVAATLSNAESPVQAVVRALALPETIDRLLVVASEQAVIHLESYIPGFFADVIGEAINIPVEVYEFLSEAVPFDPLPSWTQEARAELHGFVASVCHIKSSRAPSN